MAKWEAGKTTISIAVAEYLETAFRRNGSKKSPYPVLVMGAGDCHRQKELAERSPRCHSRVTGPGHRYWRQASSQTDENRALSGVVGDHSGSGRIYGQKCQSVPGCHNAAGG